MKDIGIVELRTNKIMLEKLATLVKIPVITTASEPKGPKYERRRRTEILAKVAQHR